MDQDRKILIEEYTGTSLCIFCSSPGEWIIKSTRATEKAGTYRVNHLCPVCYKALRDYFREVVVDDERDKHNEDPEETERLDI